MHGRLIENTGLGIDKVVVSPLGGLMFFEEVKEICELLGLAVIKSELYGAFIRKV